MLGRCRDLSDTEVLALSTLSRSGLLIRPSDPAGSALLPDCTLLPLLRDCPADEDCELLVIGLLTGLGARKPPRMVGRVGNVFPRVKEGVELKELKPLCAPM